MTIGLQTINQMLSSYGGQIGLAIASVLVAEILRDCYHIAGHYWKPLQPWHNLHHKAYRADLSKVSMEIYCQAELFNDVPEATFMVLITAAIAGIGHIYGLGWGMAFGTIYSLGFWVTALARSQGLLLATDITHKPGDLVQLPSQWTVNRTYHWRHHFDRGEAYFCSTFTLVDQILGTALSLKGKSIAVTGASGTMGRALITELSKRGARVIALTSSPHATFESAIAEGKPDRPIEVITWQLGNEAALRDRLQKVDILILNHGVNVLGARDSQAVQQSYEVNTFSVFRWMDLFLETVTESKHIATKEIWVNTSEAEVNPAFSPLYELSKRAIGDLITMRRLDAPITIRKLILGPFKSDLNPYGVMSAKFVAWAIVALAQRDFRDIIVTVNPLTFIAYPVKEFWRSLYFRIFSRRPKSHQEPS
ncbi:MAG: bifunctional sterol desaturase/short chain dehydrogenase [Pseudanabaenaceae cyanobacterium bins.39]|nr:bifunctional sterol desaturase/short chain dehydrogenase [Pseudanabaenaceae cyanobacterium bins.39]